MTTNEAKRLFRFTQWANAQMFTAAAGMPEGELAGPAASSFPSVGHTLAHIAGAEWVWLRRWLGESPQGMPDWVGTPVLADIRERLAKVESERDAFLSVLADEDLGKEVGYRLFNGKASSSPLGDLIRHVVNHSTYHRGQAATQMRQLGRTPPSTDYIRYLREEADRVR